MGRARNEEVVGPKPAEGEEVQKTDGGGGEGHPSRENATKGKRVLGKDGPAFEHHPCCTKPAVFLPFRT